LRRNRCGVPLAANGIVVGDVVGVGVPRRALGAPAQPGRVLPLTGDGELRTVVVPQSVA
jgi:S-DNA-T family DNA segregation ATPase FtsK/SpoIIIE